MHKTNSIIMCVPKMTVFETAANLELWPRILPHYRYIRYLERSPGRNVVVMAATRERIEVRFRHLKAFTKGMRVVWTFQEVPTGVLVEIEHDLAFRVKILAPIADKIIGDFFIHDVANKTLRYLKSYVEASTDKVTA
jgi:Polyketide cyclase / dehydrase and lipid transport